MEYFLDTNVFLRFYVKDDTEEHGDTKQLIERVETGKVSSACIAQIVLAEIDWTLHSYYRVQKRDRIEFLQRLRSSLPLRELQDFDSDLAVDLHENNKVKFIDCLIASHPRIQSGDITVISYDADFDKLGITRVEPTALVNKDKD